MNVFSKKTIFCLAAGCLLTPGMVLADTITPATFSATLDVGESVTVHKTVTVSNESSAPVDVFFLADETGSMWGEISAVKAGMSDILTNTATLGDVAYGVGGYRDTTDTYMYSLKTAITTDTSAVQTGINSLAADGGGDWPEANLFALESVATSSATGWRDDSTRILVWFGDAPGHDPSGTVTEASATAALVDQNITVEAVDVGSLDSYGQATRIANATGGHYYSGVDSTSIVGVITDAITAVVNEYSSVDLGLGYVPDGVAVTSTPGYSGDWDRSVERTFSFDVTFTGMTEGIYDFSIAALVDGAAVAWEDDSITVSGAAPVPEPATMLLFGTGLAGLVAIRRKKA